MALLILFLILYFLLDLFYKSFALFPFRTTKTQHFFFFFAWHKNVKSIVQVSHNLLLPSPAQCRDWKVLINTLHSALTLNHVHRFITFHGLHLHLSLITLSLRVCLNSHPSASISQIFTWVFTLLKCKQGPAVNNWDILICRKGNIKGFSLVLCPKGKWETF